MERLAIKTETKTDQKTFIWPLWNIVSKIIKNHNQIVKKQNRENICPTDLSYSEASDLFWYFCNLAELQHWDFSAREKDHFTCVF